MTIKQAEPDAGELPLLDVLRAILRRKWMVVAMVVAGTAAGWFYQAATVATYTAEALIVLEARGRTLTSQEGRVHERQLNGEIIQTEVEILGSRSHIRQVVIENDLADDPHLVPVETTSWFQPLKDAFAFEVIGQPYQLQSPSDPAPMTAVTTLAKNLEVAREAKTHVIAVRYTSSDPEQASNIANAVAIRYILNRDQDRFEYANRADRWISNQLQTLKVRYERSSAELAAREHALATPAVDALMAHTDHIAAFNRELLNARVQRHDKENRLRRVRQLLANGDAGGAIEDIGSSVILQNLHTLKAHLLRREAELSSQLGPKHPQIKNIHEERNQLLSRIEAEQRLLIKRFENDVSLAQQRERAISDELERLKGKNTAMANASTKLERLRQEVALDQRVYEEFLSQFKPIENGDAISQPDARIISEATPPVSPAWPKSKLIVMIAFSSSLGLALIVTYLRELSETGFCYRGDVIRTTGQPPIGMILKHPARPFQAHDAIVDMPGSAFSESVRALLMELVPERPVRDRGKTMIVASTLPAEGKSTTTLALGRAAALDGLRTLVIDGDIRRPSLHKLANIPLGPGLDCLLRGDLAPKDIIIEDNKTTLAILPGASSGAHQDHRLSGQAPFDDLFERLRRQFDLILVDSSPLIAVADARVMMRHADEVLLLARWRQTTRALVCDCIESIETSGGKLAGIALTQVDAKRLQAYEPIEQTYSRKQVEGYYTG